PLPAAECADAAGQAEWQGACVCGRGGPHVGTLPSGCTRAQAVLCAFLVCGKRCTIHMVLHRSSATALDGVDTGNSSAAYVLDPVADQITHVQVKRTKMVF